MIPPLTNHLTIYCQAALALYPTTILQTTLKGPQRGNSMRQYTYFILNLYSISYNQVSESLAPNQTVVGNHSQHGGPTS